MTTTKKEAPASNNKSHPENLYVITENGEQCFLWRSNQLTYIAQERQEIPTILAAKFGHLATRLDLSYNSLTSFKNINSFTNLNELILDNNLLGDDQLDFVPNLRLKTLSLNKNKLTNLYKLVNSIKVCMPNLEYLSLIGNPLCPGPAISAAAGGSLSDANKRGASNIFELVLDPNARVPISPHHLTSSESVADELFGQQKYRHFIIYHLPNLRFLDSSPVTPSERDEALRRCFWMGQANLNQLNGTGQARETNSSGSSGGRIQQRHHSEESPSPTGDDNTGGQFRLTIMSSNMNDEQQNRTIEQPKGKSSAGGLELS